MLEGELGLLLDSGASSTRGMATPHHTPDDDKYFKPIKHDDQCEWDDNVLLSIQFTVHHLSLEVTNNTKCYY